jgi:uncharacterized membrane protein YeaQ/YmgE (transglycosylase-associated protein family)
MGPIITIIVELIAGALAGNAAGAASKNISLGTAGNSIAGAIGGVVLGQVLSAMGIGAPGVEAASGSMGAGGFNIGALIAQLVASGAGGAALTAIAGIVKNSMKG